MNDKKLFDALKNPKNLVKYLEELKARKNGEKPKKGQ